MPDLSPGTLQACVVRKLSLRPALLILILSAGVALTRAVRNEAWWIKGTYRVKKMIFLLRRRFLRGKTEIPRQTPAPPDAGFS